MVSEGEMWVFNSSCITQPQSQISTDSIAHNCYVVLINRYEKNPMITNIIIICSLSLFFSYVMLLLVFSIHFCVNYCQDKNFPIGLVSSNRVPDWTSISVCGHRLVAFLRVRSNQ